MSNYKLERWGGLIAPESYWWSTSDQVDSVCNGCGPAGWKNAIVPDAMWGLDISQACQIHDWMYEFGSTQMDKDIADDLFLTNLIAIIDDHGGWLKWPRSYRAMTYYRAVADAGNSSFWRNKKGA